MFNHSIPVPRLYKTAAKIAKQVSEGRGSIKQLVYEGKHPNIKALYALVVQIFQKTEEIERLLKKSKLLVKEPQMDQWLAKVLLTELLWGKKRLCNESKPIKTILAYEQIFKAHLSDVSNNDEELQQVYKPRFVRVNTLKMTVNEAIEGFRSEGWFLKRFTDSNDYLGFLDAVRSLNSEEFMIDFHVPSLLIFPPKTQFYKHPAYKDGSIVLQDKASCLPIHILNPEPASVVFDMCAAPGMKTTQCASIMKDTGKIYAVEINTKRYEVLKKLVGVSTASCVETINADATTLTGEQYPDVKYIIVDPSCSGSGITDRVEIGQQDRDHDKDRLDKLAAFQITMLRHALIRFPKAKRVVYSTCSVYPEENEDVVRQILETCTTFKLVPAADFVGSAWQNFGAAEFGDIGNYCLYARPDIDLTSGFFVAVFERLQKGEQNPFLNHKIYAMKVHNRLKKNQGKDSQTNEKKSEDGNDQEDENINEANEEIKVEECESSEVPKKKKKKSKHDEARINDVTSTENETIENVAESKKKKKKKDESKRKLDSEEVQSVKIEIKEEVEINALKNETLETKKKKKKKKKDKKEESWLDNLISAEIHEESFTEEVQYVKSESKEEVEINETLETKTKKKEKNEESWLDHLISEEMQREEIDNNEHTESNESVVGKKKNKKKDRSVENVTDETTEYNETKPKKKKKKKDKDRSELLEIRKIELEAEDIPQKERSKRKRKTKENNNSADVSLNSNDSTEEVPKKKKRKN